METIGFIISTAQAIDQISGLVSRNVSAVTAVRSLARTVEEKAIFCYSAACELENLTGLLGVNSTLFMRTQRNLRDIRN